MQRAIIFYTDGSSHKLAIPSVTIEKFTDIIDSNISGYPEKVVARVTRWIERP